MKKKIYALLIIALVAVYNLYNSQEKEKLSDIMLDNVEALAQSGEGSGKCPNPYDVYNHQLGHKQRTARVTLDAGCEFTIAGKKFKALEFSANATINVTYELGNCDKESLGNCCPNSRNGEINIIRKS